MNNGTNNYNAKKLTPSETVVSRTLQPRYRSYSNVVWRAGKPALDSEWNLINDMMSEWMNSFITSKYPSGWMTLGTNKYPSGNSAIANNMQYYTNEDSIELVVPNALINGWPLLIAGCNWADTFVNSINLPAASSSSRYDFVFLEVFRAQVRSRDTNNNKIAQNKPTIAEVYKFGNVQYGGVNLPDDIVDPAIKPASDGIETSQRVQVQYRIRVASGVSYTSDAMIGFEDISVHGQGASINPQTLGYNFTNMVGELGDPGLWRCGTGDEASTTALGSVDGYSYAIPMFKVFRRGTVVYNDSTNQNGNSIALSGVSDRPDGKYYDGIDATDIIDLRYKTIIGNINFNEIIEKNLDKLFKGELKSLRNNKMYYDLISDSDVTGYTDVLHNQGCSGKRTIWSDSSVTQSDIFAEVKATTTNNSLDAYRASGTGNWQVGNQIIVQTTPKLPTGTIIKNPRIYIEDKSRSDISSKGTWSGINTTIATFTFTIATSNDYDIWIYYDIGLPAGQGISNVPNNLYRINYTNYASNTNGSVVRGLRLEPTVTRHQDLFNHPLNSISSGAVITESSFVSQRKQLNISPLIQTTTIRDGVTRTLEVQSLDVSAKQLYSPHKLQHVKGVWTAATGGTEVATQQILNNNVSSVDTVNNDIVINANYYVASLTSLKYDPTGAFIGGEIELLVASGGLYAPVFQHNENGLDIGTHVKLYDLSGSIFDIPSGATDIHFRWGGKRIKARAAGTGYGFNVNEYLIDCSEADNFAGLSDRQQLWLDIDYLGAPHDGAELRVMYDSVPYQGSDVGGQTLQLIHKRDKGVFFNNGTGGGTISTTANVYYTPMSPKLPGSSSDYLRDGSLVQISSIGTKRINGGSGTDAYFYAAYDLYGYLGGGTLWQNGDFTMPVTSGTTTYRGFMGDPLLEVLFELPVVDATHAEFILPVLVRDKITSEVYLFIQIGNKGVHKTAEGPFYIDIFHLNERLLLK